VASQERQGGGGGGDDDPGGECPPWSPLSHTLIHGPTEAVIVDPPFTVAQTTALADWIASLGKRLGYVYITHWHSDHWLGTGQLTKRFPGVTVYASEPTITRMNNGTPRQPARHAVDQPVPRPAS